MNLYVYCFPGHVISGNAVLIAGDEEAAYKLVRKEMDENGLKTDEPILLKTFTLDIPIPCIAFFDNGDM